MTPRRYVKDPKWAKIREQLYALQLKTERAYQRVKRSWHAFARLMQRIKQLQRRLEKREGELDAAPSTERRLHHES